MTNQKELQKIGEWVGGEHTGMSSKFLCQLALGDLLAEVRYPYDPADLWRCVRFLNILSEDRKKEVLRMAKNRSEHWEILVDKWEDLMELFNEECIGEGWRAPKLYKFMQELFKQN